MKVKAAAGALGAPGWGDEECCEPRLCAVTPAPAPLPLLQLRAQVAAGGERLCPEPFWGGGWRVCAFCLWFPPPKNREEPAPLWRRGCGGCVELGGWGGGRVNSLEGSELRGKVGVSKMR